MLDSLKEAGGVRLRGEVGEVWVGGCKAGLVYKWVVIGWSADFRMEAERYKLYPDLFKERGREVSLRLNMGIGIVRAEGSIWTDFIADGHSHRALVVKGRRMSWMSQRAASAT